MSKSKKELSFAEEVEQSLRKKFRKNIWCKFTKAINEYELVKEGLQMVTRLPSAFPEEKILCCWQSFFKN